MQEQIDDLQDQIDQLSDTTLQYVETAPAYNYANMRHSWADWDLSFLPAEAKYVEVTIFAYCNELVVVGARKNGSTVNRKFNAYGGPQSGACSTQFTVELDASRIIEIYTSYGNTLVWLSGYWK